MMADGGPAGNTRSTRAGTGTVRPAPSVTVAARARRGASSDADSPAMTVRRSSCMPRLPISMSRLALETRPRLVFLALESIVAHDARLNDAGMQRQQHELRIEAVAALECLFDPVLHRMCKLFI